MTKPCDDCWREELTDHVLGSPASASLTEHLGNCAVCAEVLRDWKARMAQVDAGIGALTASEPSPHAARRIMAHLRTGPERVSLPGWQWRAATLGALLIVAAIFAYEWRAREHRQQAERALSAASVIASWRSPTEGLLPSSTDRWLKAPPRLGDYFYRLDSNVPVKERENP